MLLYSSAPEMSVFFDDKPTLLVCWWVTLFSTIIILIRVAGRLVRTEHLFPEDWTAFWALVPLYIRMALIHVVLLWGTNNADFTNEMLTEKQLRHKEMASRLVLAARIFFAATLWVLKWSTLEFLKRLTDSTWERSYTKTILYARISLGISFVVVVVSLFGECRPFYKSWQVLPDPGPHCRQAYAHLLVTGSLNIVTDLMLVIIPIPIIVRSTMTPKRKTQLITLFSLNLSVVVVSFIRVHQILTAHGSQQSRSLMASIELLFAVASANALVLGSFVRDRGVKKRKFKFGDENLVADHQSAAGVLMGTPARYPVYKHQWGSDEDLVQGLGLGLKPELRQDTKSMMPVDHPHFSTAALGLRSASEGPSGYKKKLPDEWQMPFHNRQKSRTEMSEDSLIPRDHHSEQVVSQTVPVISSSSGLSPMPPPSSRPKYSFSPSTSSLTPSPAQAAAISAAASSPLLAFNDKVSFFDLGGLLDSRFEETDDTNDPSSFRRESWTHVPEPLTLAQQQNQSYWAYQSAMLAAPMPTASLSRFTSGKRASTAILHDLGGLLAPITSAGGNNGGNSVSISASIGSSRLAAVASGAATGLGESSGSRDRDTGVAASGSISPGGVGSGSGSGSGLGLSQPKKKTPLTKVTSAGSPGPSLGTSPDDDPGFTDLGGLLK